MSRKSEEPQLAQVCNSTWHPSFLGAHYQHRAKPVHYTVYYPLCSFCVIKSCITRIVQCLPVRMLVICFYTQTTMPCAVRCRFGLTMLMKTRVYLAFPSCSRKTSPTGSANTIPSSKFPTSELKRNAPLACLISFLISGMNLFLNPAGSKPFL